jgi:hypothetical protein
VTPGGTFDLRFEVRAGFKPSAETNWVAVRWWSESFLNRLVYMESLKDNVGITRMSHLQNGGLEKAELITDIECVSGCISKSPVAIEGETRWRVFQQHRTVVKTPIWKEALRPRGTPTEHSFHILELNNFNAAKFSGAARRQNSLLTYVAETQASMADGGWLFPQGDAEKAAAQTLARLATLDERARLPRGEAREEFLKTALVNLSYQAFRKHAPRLADGIAAVAPLLNKLAAAKEKTSDALSAASKLNEGEAARLIAGSAQLSHLPDPDAHDVGEKLAAYLAGADEMLEELLAQQRRALTIKCQMLARLEFQGRGSLSALRNSAEIGSLCKTK